MATADGDIIVCGMKGDFIARVPSSPQGKRIDCIIPYSRGLVLGGENGMIFPYERTSAENVIYKVQQAPIWSGDRDQPTKIEIGPESITQMVLNVTEDVLYYIDRHN